MTAYAIRRVLILIPLVLGVTFLVFTALYILPGDAVASMMAETGASAEDLARMRSDMGLDQPFHVQYFNFVKNAVQGDFGRSLFTKRSVIGMIGNQIGATLELGGAALVIALSVGIPLGVAAAVHRNTWFDTASMTVALLGVSMPVFWVGIIMMQIFSLYLGWLPTGGTGGLAKLIMPAVALSFSTLGVIARVTRSTMLEVLGMDYIRTARAKGLQERVITMKHALRNALIPVVTLLGLRMGVLIGGAVLVETVFSRQGVGFMTANSIIRQDFPVVQGTSTILVAGFLLVNLIVDLSYALLDPRIRYD